MNKILLAYDGGDAARDALTAAAQLAGAAHARVGVISVVPTTTLRTSQTVMPWDNPKMHREQLAEAKTRLEALGVEPELIETVGDPAQLIEAVAERNGYDTIVLGHPAHARGLAGWLHRSVPWDVMNHARMTVVVAP